MAAALAMAGFGLAASNPASAGFLTIRITDSNAGSYTCVDQDSCDTNSAVNAVGINGTLANAALGATSVFDITSLGASSNFSGGDPLSAIITSSGGIVANRTTPGKSPLVVEISQTGWTKPTDLLRSLYQGATTGFTNSGIGDFMLFHALSDQANLLFAGNPAFTPPAANAANLPTGAADDFVTASVKFDASSGDPDCGAPAGQLQNCNGSSLLNAFNETNPFSLTQRMSFNIGDSPIANGSNRIDFTTQASEFSFPGQVPEPGTIPLMGLGLMGLLAIARRKKV